MKYAANLALFLLEREGSIYARHYARMSAKQQRELFGRYIGKGIIIIDGEKETICNQVKRCFGLDYENKSITKWKDL